MITAKKRTEADQANTDNKTTKKEGNNKHQNNNEQLSLAEQTKNDEVKRHANVDIIWHDVTIPSDKLSQLKSF